MKIKTTKNALATFLVAFATTGSLFAQEATLVLNPSEITPAPTGYYIGGVMKDGVLHNGCGAGANQNVIEHAASSHNESGTHAGFTFANVSVMPNCNGKGNAEAGFPLGYIQLREFITFSAYEANPADPALVYGYIMTPQITNLRSLEVKAGSDISINDNRSVTFGIESSTDNGVTWQPVATQVLIDQGGRTYTFEAGGSNPGFNQVAALSNTQAIRLRILPWRGTRRDDISGDRGQRLKVHQITLVATPQTPTSVKADVENTRPFYQLSNKAFMATKGNLHVYSITGALVGSGKSVHIPRSGLYIVKSETGLTKKVFVQ